jgi:hypothetical protein
MNILDQIESLTESWDVEFKATQGANGRGALPSGWVQLF